MLMLILNVVYILVAIAMIALVLLQRGAGAAAGSGFGAGASGTVFGARGASNFMSKSTKWLAVTFFGISLFMAWYAGHSVRPAEQQQDLGVMGRTAPVPVVPGEVSQPASTVPAAAGQGSSIVPSPSSEQVPANGGTTVPAPSPPSQ
ncbi:MAG: preprotein translocase subunit SecG [Xanthomonadaceae bacterium]|jgi:preprotein translocase subunit SecG|nr:preprotein translocase subunit SecG [Xanthomonadaceae bacterium]